MDQQSRRYRRHRKLYHRRRHIDKRCPPYYNGTADSFFSDKDEERIKGATIHVETGQPATWVSEGAISDFNGKAHTAYLGKSSSSYPAGGYCYQYSTSGKSAGEWYLPSAGELTLLWELQKPESFVKTNKIVSMILHAKRTGLLPNTRQNPPGI